MRVRLIHPTTNDILFDGDPNDPEKKGEFNAALKLAPEARVEDVKPMERPPPPKKELAYLGMGIWIGVGLIVGSLLAGAAVRLFIWAAGF